MLALALPVLAGIAYLWRFGAPATYAAVNGAALLLALLLIAIAPRIPDGKQARIAMVLLLAMLFLPLLTGPELNHIARWIPMGPFALHAGALAVPALVVLAAREDQDAPTVLAAAVFAASLQPDMATGAALMLASVGLYLATQDWKFGLLAVITFFASLVMAVHGELPAQPFVERVLASVAIDSPATALALLAVLLGSFLIILHALPAPRTARLALAGSLFGFSIAAVFSNYPSILIGYGAAPILGYGLALALLVRGGKNKAIAV